MKKAFASKKRKNIKIISVFGTHWKIGVFEVPRLLHNRCTTPSLLWRLMFVSYKISLMQLQPILGHKMNFISIFEYSPICYKSHFLFTAESIILYMKKAGSIHLFLFFFHQSGITIYWWRKPYNYTCPAFCGAFYFVQGVIILKNERYTQNNNRLFI